MDKSRNEFETWIEKDFWGGLDGPGEFDEARNCYVAFPVHMAWKGWQASRKQALEEAAQEAATWKGAKLLLNAGEMTMQEKRTATAVALGIASAIRSLEGNATGGGQ